MPTYANIIVDISHEQLDKTFQYKIPDSLQSQVGIGSLVFIPFGRGNRMIKGYVIELTDKPEFDPNRMKDIADLAKGGIAVESQLIQLASWIKVHYGSTMIQALKTVMPIKDKV
ncbi:MAG: primosomal protein N', partial [Lachnospiraceae bacterium]